VDPATECGVLLKCSPSSTLSPNALGGEADPSCIVPGHCDAGRFRVNSLVHATGRRHHGHAPPPVGRHQSPPPAGRSVGRSVATSTAARRSVATSTAARRSVATSHRHPPAGRNPKARAVNGSCGDAIFEKPRTLVVRLRHQ
jgi:hypothetical protein